MTEITRSAGPTVALKTLAVVGMFCLLLAVGILNLVPPADGYEISLFQAFPFYFWVLFTFSALIGQLVIVGSVRYNGGRDRIWILGLALVVTCGIILLLIPFIRGYPMYGGVDELTHVGFIRDIPEVGIAGLIYPAMHLIIYTASSATGLEAPTVLKLLPLVVSLVYIGGSFYMLREFYNQTHALYGLPFILVLFIGYKTAVPNTLSVLYIPFILYLFIKERRTGAISIAYFLIISIFGIVLLHPLTTFFLIVTLGIYVVIEKTNRFESDRTHPTMVPPLTVVVFCVWYLAFLGIIRRFERVVRRVTGTSGGSSELNTVTSAVSTYSPDPIDLAMIVILDYGDVLILYPLAGLFILLAVYLWLRNEIDGNIYIVLFSCIFILFTGVSVVAFVVDLGFGWGRVLFYQTVFVTVLSASFFYFLYQQLSSQTLQRTLTVLLVIVLCTLTGLAIYGSAASLAETDYNSQSTQMDIDGSAWVLNNHDEGIPIDAQRLALWRYENYHRGTLNASVRKDGTSPPDHFGYDGNETAGQAYEESHYLIITKLGRLTYPKVYAGYQQYWSYRPADFRRLERDRTVSRVYHNGEFELYYITAEDQQLSSD